MNKILIYLSIVLLFSNSFAENKVISAVSNIYPPFVDPEIPTDGLSVEIIRAAFETQGYTITLNYKLWSDALDGVKEGKYDILVGAWFTKERTKYLIYSDPYSFIRIKFAKRKGDTFEYMGISSLRGKKIGIIKDFGYSDKFNNATNFIKVGADSITQNFRKLVNGEIDLTLEDETVAIAKIKKSNPDLLKYIEFTKTPLTKRGNYVVSGLKNPRHKELIHAFNIGLDAIKANGLYEEIMRKYGIK